MRRLIIIIMVLLLYPSLILAEENGDSIDESKINMTEKDVENLHVSRDIASDIFYYILEKNKFAYDVEAFLYAAGFDNLASEVRYDIDKVMNDEGHSLETFLKHKKKYKYEVSDEEMILWTFTVLDGIQMGYILGMHESLCLVFADNQDLADLYKHFAFSQYEQYLKEKKGTKDKP